MTDAEILDNSIIDLIHDIEQFIIDNDEPINGQYPISGKYYEFYCNIRDSIWDFTEFVCDSNREFSSEEIRAQLEGFLENSAVCLRFPMNIEILNDVILSLQVVSSFCVEDGFDED